MRFTNQQCGRKIGSQHLDDRYNMAAKYRLSILINIKNKADNKLEGKKADIICS